MFPRVCRTTKKKSQGFPLERFFLSPLLYCDPLKFSKNQFFFQNGTYYTSFERIFDCEEQFWCVKYKILGFRPLWRHQNDPGNCGKLKICLNTTCCTSSERIFYYEKHFRYIELKIQSYKLMWRHQKHPKIFVKKSMTCYTPVKGFFIQNNTCRLYSLHIIKYKELKQRIV